MSRRVAVMALCFLGCATGSEPAELTQVGPIELSPPAGWTSRELASDTREWVPARNDRRESVTVIVGPKFLGGADRAFRKTRTALGLLPDSRIVGATKLSTKTGIAGMQYDVTFRPAAGDGRIYRRSHVVLFANDQTFHVLYTAGDTQPAGAALAHVLDTIQVGG